MPVNSSSASHTDTPVAVRRSCVGLSRHPRLRYGRFRRTLRSVHIEQSVTLEEFQSLCEEGVLVDLRICYYAKATCLVIDATIISATHELLKKWVWEAICALPITKSQSARTTANVLLDVYHTLIMEDNRTFKHFKGAFENDAHVADLALLNRKIPGFDSEKQCMPVAIVEAGVSESYSHLTTKIVDWLYGSALTRVVIVLKAWKSSDLASDTEGLSDADCFKTYVGSGHPDAAFNPANVAPLGSPPLGSKELKDAIMQDNLPEISHALRAAAVAKELYAAYMDSRQASSMPNISIRAEVWRRTPISTDEDPSFVLTRDEVKYILVRGRLVDSAQSAFSLWPSDLVVLDPAKADSLDVPFLIKSDYLFLDGNLQKAAEEDGYSKRAANQQSGSRRRATPSPPPPVEPFTAISWHKRRKFSSV